MSPLTRIFPLVPLLLSPIITNALPLDERDTTTVFVSGPVATSYPQPASAIPGFPIHSSCNATERNQLEKALGDTIKLAQTAAQYVETNGNSSTLYQKYFGSAPTAEVIGWYEKVVHGQREGILFRCDDIDGNCHQEGWGGHWRGENATLETVICPLSYSTRQPLEALCGGGYTVSNGALNHYFASDLLHRLYHVTSIGEGAVEHYADSYAECLELAESEPSEAVRNSHTLQYFALEVYAFEVAAPGEGCTGKPEEAEESAASGTATATASASASASASARSDISSASTVAAVSTSQPATTLSTVAATTASVASAQQSETASGTTSAAAECHTHADGEVHCV